MRTWRKSFPDKETSNLVLEGIRHEVLKRIKRTHFKFLASLRAKLSTETNDDSEFDEPDNQPFDDDYGEDGGGRVVRPRYEDYIDAAEEQVNDPIERNIDNDVIIENTIERPPVSMMEGVREKGQGELGVRRRGRPCKNKLAEDELVMKRRDDLLERKDVIFVLNMSFNEKTQCGGRVAPRRRSTGKQKSWGIWGIWGISGAQVPQDAM
ncbi:hypothetical protein P167DRAFT_569483 [Morchella conica CCBAS932]|uniref:Uncharacterized protein n=1 Tax=Morchella conica CCBAS932 TaxID=1392247 RepID=A0A3N4L8F7_9PEZI|nr:hypothetical protein P167DRAFT_569483 [Morchella conica CCBAS932]